MTIQVAGVVGDSVGADGAQNPVKMGRFNELVLSQLRGRWYEHNIRGRLFSASMALTAISAATFTSATLGPTGTPIAGLWNPTNSGVNAEIELALLSVIVTALGAATGPGGFAWYASVGNTAQPSTGAKGISRLTLSASGKCQNICGVAMTGQTTALTLLAASALLGGQSVNATITNVAGATQTQTGISEEHLEGSIILPPGGILALLAQTTPVAHSAIAGLVYAEVPTT